MSQFRKTLTRIGGSAVALAAATALIVPGVASAEPSDPQTGSSATGSLERATEFLPEDVRTVFQLLTSGELDFDKVGECVREEFGQEVVSGNPFQIVIDCVLQQAPDDDETEEDPDKNEIVNPGDDNTKE